MRMTRTPEVVVVSFKIRGRGLLKVEENVPVSSLILERI
jgi:hypothetical protein